MKNKKLTAMILCFAMMFTIIHPALASVSTTGSGISYESTTSSSITTGKGHNNAFMKPHTTTSSTLFSKLQADTTTSSAVKIGDKIWIKRGSNVYKTPENKDGHTLLSNYQIKITDIITDDTGAVTWYSFDFISHGLGEWLLQQYHYVQAENTSVENPEADEHACNCGENAPENLANHADNCPRKQYVKTLFEGKTAEEIYIKWKNCDEVTQNDLLNMLEVYNKTLCDEVKELIENRLDSTTVEMEDGNIVSVDGIPEDAWLMVSAPDAEKTQVVDSIADNLFSVDSSLAYGGVLSLNYDIKIMQGENEWQPENGESVYVTIEIPDFYLDYRTYLQGIHILDTVDAISRAVESGEAISQTEPGLADKFPVETAAASAVGFPEDTIVYTIMLPETGDMWVQNGDIVIDATSFSTSNITAFNVDNSEHLSEVEDTGLKIDKTATVKYETGEGFVELSSYVKGSVSNTPTDVVLVIDQSGSMWTAVDPDDTSKKNVIYSNNLEDLNKKNGARRGYYVAYDLNTVNNSGDGKARLVRYRNNEWQVTKPFDAEIYDKYNTANQRFVGFVNTCSYDTEEEWEKISDGANYIYAVSISGALYEALNIFMDEMKNAVNCRVAIATFAGTIHGDGDSSNGDNNQDIWNKNLMGNNALDKNRDYQGSGIFVDGTLKWDGTVQTWDAPYRNSYGAAFEDPSTSEGQEILYDTIESINTDYGNTPTAIGLLYARRLFNEAGNRDSQKIAIVFTDGIPSPEYLGTRGPETCGHTLADYASGDTYAATALECDYCDLVTTYDKSTKKKGFAVRTTYVDQANKLKQSNGTTVYSIGPKAGRAGVDVLSKIATSSNHYYNASGDDIAKVFREIAGFIVNASQQVNKESHVTDFISDSFKLPDDATENNIEVYTADYTGVGTDGKDEFATPVKLEDAKVLITEAEKKIEVWNFDYEANAVGMEGTAPTGKKLIVRIPIVKNPDFLGGDKVTTNNYTLDTGEKVQSGIYNGALLVGEPFTEPETNVKVQQINPGFKNSQIYISQAAELPHILNIGKFNVAESEEEYLVDGINNEYVDIVYTVKDGSNKLFEYTIPAKTAIEDIPNFEEEMYAVLTDDKTYNLTCDVISINDRERNKSHSDGTGTISVYKPVITFKDSVMNLGDTANYAEYNMVLNNESTYGGYGTNVVWKHGDSIALIADMGMAPELQYTYDVPAGAFTEEKSVKIEHVISPTNNHLNHKVPMEMDLLAYTTFYREGCTFRLCDHKECNMVTDNNPNFVVHLDTFDLLIKKNGANLTLDPAQTFRFRITGENNFSIDVTIKGNGEVRVVSLPVENRPYKVTELIDWSWRYEPKDGSSEKGVDLTTNNGGVVTVPFTNERKIPFWLSGDSYCENWWGGSDGNVVKRDKDNHIIINE